VRKGLDRDHIFFPPEISVMGEVEEWLLGCNNFCMCVNVLLKYFFVVDGQMGIGPEWEEL
jgi:hypothetical protein